MRSSTSRLHNPTRLDTACTDPNSYCLAILNTSYPLEVGVPTFLGLIVGMADIIANDWFFSTNLAYLGHFEVSLKVLHAIAVYATAKSGRTFSQINADATLFQLRQTFFHTLVH